MKKSKVIAPALALIAFSTAASITGTVAWFTANNIATVTGMQFKTKVSDNLFIAQTNTTADESQYSNTINQEIKGILEPVSTCDAVAFYYTTNAKANGDASSDAYTTYNASTPASDTTNYANAFSEAYAVTKTGAAALITGLDSAVAYIDYSFYIKATNSTASAKDLKMTRCNILQGGAVLTENDMAWRVAMFVQDSAYNTDTSTAVTGSDRVTILRRSGSANFDNSPKAVTSTSALGTVTYDTAAVVKSIPASQTVYEKVTIRLWLEGEDTKCTVATYAALTNLYTLDLAFKMDSTVAVTNIGSSTLPAA